MPDFKLTSKYQPAGDQPKAIEKLVAGLRSGDREQTLLGVTGSGKSVTGDTPVLVKRNNVVSYDPIGVIVDEYFATHSDLSQLTSNGESEFIDLPDQTRLETWSFDSATGRQGWKAVTQVSRHMANVTMAVETNCGRAVTSTSDHNFYVAREGRIEVVDGRGLRVGDWVPMPAKIPDANKPMPHLNVADYLGRDFKAYVEMDGYERGGALSWVVNNRKEWAVAGGTERISLAGYNSAVALAPMPAITSIGTNKLAMPFKPQLELSQSLLRFLGYFIAEGHATQRYIVISTADQIVVRDILKVCEQLDVTYSKRKWQYDHQISSSLLSYLLKKWCGGSAFKKKLPSFWMDLSNRQLAEVLRAYFSGDGGVDGAQVTACTVSDQLSSDLLAALLRFGIVARRRRKNFWSNQTGRDHATWIVSISGQDQLSVFKRDIGFTMARKRQALSKILGKPYNTNVDLIPIAGSQIREMRQARDLLQRDVADGVGCERSYISMLENGFRSPSRTVAQRLVSFFANTSGPAHEQAMTELETLTRLRWSQIADVRFSSKPELVYDFAVRDNESFLAGEGGIFVHNTFTMANIVQQLQRPTLVLSHNKTLAAQLYGEFKSFFPENAVQYFVSYYDYYQPEAYIPRSDTFIEKDSSINEEIDRLRHAATMSLLTRRDVLIVASVSCIYGLGNVSDYTTMTVDVKVGQTRLRDKMIRQLTDIQYQRNDIDFSRGKFRVRGDVVDVWPIGEEVAYRLEFYGDELERIRQVDALTGEMTGDRQELKIFPAKHYVTPREKLEHAVQKIGEELDGRLLQLEAAGKNLEAQRLKQRTKFDMEMLAETGMVPGIENYSRFLSEREPGEQPATLMDYFPDDFLLFVDESHITLPQVRGMYNGDRARKETLVDYGFRLPSAFDNRPLKFAEFDRHINQAVYVSATPAEFELSKSSQIVEQVIRPTGLLDPQLDVRPVKGQVDDLIAEIRATVAKGQRVLVTTLTKRMSEDLTEYLKELGVKVQYLHSEVNTLDRVDILQDLRAGVYDVLVGINLLREGLDLPEVSLVAILDADKEGFLRGEAALIQTIGRAARHVEGRVIMYADRTTEAMRVAIDTTQARRKVQEAYNREHGITPEGIKKAMGERMQAAEAAETADVRDIRAEDIPKDERKRLVEELTQQMQMAAENLQFEKAAALRDQIDELKGATKKPRRAVRGR